MRCVHVYIHVVDHHEDNDEVSEGQQEPRRDECLRSHGFAVLSHGAVCVSCVRVQVKV